MPVPYPPFQGRHAVIEVSIRSFPDLLIHSLSSADLVNPSMRISAHPPARMSNSRALSPRNDPSIKRSLRASCAIGVLHLCMSNVNREVELLERQGVGVMRGEPKWRQERCWIPEDAGKANGQIAAFRGSYAK